MSIDDLLRAYSAGERDFSGADLSGSVLPSTVTLQGACLARAGLERAEWRQANLGEADLRGADCTDAHLEGACLRYVKAERILLYGAWLEGADLREARMAGADISIASLRGVQTARANLARVTLERTDLRQAILTITNLRHADLREADLTDADLRYADLTGADLRWATLEGANLHGAQLTNTLQDETEGTPLAEQPTPLAPKGPLADATVFADLLDYIPEVIPMYWRWIIDGYSIFYSYGMIGELASLLADVAKEGAERGVPSVREDMAQRLLQFIEWGLRSNDVSVRSLFQDCVVSLTVKCRRLYPLLTSALGESSRALFEDQLQRIAQAEAYRQTPTDQ